MSTLGRTPDLSVVVVCCNMARALPRTLRSLSASYQRDIAAADYEVIVVDNGSDVPVDLHAVEGLEGDFRLLRVEPGHPSPALAINRGLAAARGGVIGVMIDGARIATPGMLHFARHGVRLYDDAVVATLGWYLGHDFQGWAVQRGYGEAREDALLDAIAWPDDGYRLFEIGTMDESSVDGWFQPVSESNALFAARTTWDAIGGVDERFDAPGGGLLNLDTFDRLLDASHDNLVLLLGEGTFHQVHGGANTNASPERQARNFAAWSAQYAAIRGRPWQTPALRPRAYVGTLPPSVLPRFVRSATDPARRDFAAPLGEGGARDVRTPVAEPERSAPIAALVELGNTAFRNGKFEAAGVIARVLDEHAPGDPGLARILSYVAPSLPLSAAPPERQAECHVAMGAACVILGDTALARTYYGHALALAPDCTEAHVALSRLRMPGDEYYHWIERLYTRLRPESVLEIGVFNGDSLALVRPPAIAIGVDPCPRITVPLHAETHVFPETSDAFFARGGTRAVLGDRPLSIGFIDGLHVFEQALRDFIALEALCGPDSLIAIHDTVPLDEPTQTREQRTTFHTGDVWKLVLCLRAYRPDLDIFTIATAPTGLTLVQGLDPSSRVLAGRYDEAVARFIDLPFAASDAERIAAFELVPNDEDAVWPRLRGLRTPLSNGVTHA
jgi:hypothetical protein